MGGAKRKIESARRGSNEGPTSMEHGPCFSHAADSCGIPKEPTRPERADGSPARDTVAHSIECGPLGVGAGVVGRTVQRHVAC